MTQTHHFLFFVVCLKATGHYVPNDQDKTINLNQYFDSVKARVNQDMSEMMKKSNLQAQAKCVTLSAQHTQFLVFMVFTKFHTQKKSTMPHVNMKLAPHQL